VVDSSNVIARNKKKTVVWKKKEETFCDRFIAKPNGGAD